MVSGRHGGGGGEVEGPKRYKLSLSQSELINYNMDGLKPEINHPVPRADSHRTVSTAGLQSKGNHLTMLSFYHMTAHDLCAIPLVGYVTRGQTKKKRRNIFFKKGIKTEGHRMVNSAVTSINAVIKVAHTHQNAPRLYKAPR